MKHHSILGIVFLALFTIPLGSFSQNFTGQWKGEFIDKSSSFGSFSGDKCEYVLELESKGDKVFGSSYTYFTENGKRYYTICKVEGVIDEKKKYLEVKEIQRTKTNIPSNIHNCFQIHKLTYFKKGDVETMEGNWTPVPNQNGNCGFGATKLSRRLLINNYPKVYASTINNKKTTDNNKSTNTNKTTTASLNNNRKTTFKKQTNKTTASNTKTIIDTTSGALANNQKTAASTTTSSSSAGSIATTTLSTSDSSAADRRKKNILSVIKTTNTRIQVSLYDNGEVDGDIISLYFNNRLILSQQKLSEKPIELTLDISDDYAANELVMYAENLGTIPPNTALMIVTDGAKKYEARITSDLEQSGVIKFIHNK